MLDQNNQRQRSERAASVGRSFGRCLRCAVATLTCAGGFAHADAPADVTLMPLGDAWAKNSINATNFRQDPITTAGNKQFATYYDPDGHVVIAERKAGTGEWKTTVTNLTGKSIQDAHNAISLMADGDGYLHLSWDHHNNLLHYVRSKTPGDIDFEPAVMTGLNEKSLSYPQFFQMPGGGLVFMYRDGASGNGNLVLDRYDIKAKTWAQVHPNLISGEHQRNAYWEACVDAKGSLHVAWVWRESPNVASNHDICYARSDDGGTTWVKSDGTPYTLPITAATAEVASPVPQNSDLMNQTSICADGEGRPVVATYYRPAGDKAVQYVIVRFDGRQWVTTPVTRRTGAFSLSGAGSKALAISRPQVLARTKDGKTGVWMIFRDADRGSRISMAACPDLSNPTWTVRDLTEFSVRFWEPSYDHVRWQRDGVLDLYVQMAGQGDGEKLEDIPPQRAQVLEWTPR